jgi:hypothetical protein
MSQLLNQNLATVLILAAIWVLPWKGVALWKAARNNSKPWFIILLVINTLAVLEIIYIFFIDKGKDEQTSQ